MQQIGSAPPPLEDVPINADLRVRDFIANGLVTNFRKRPSSAKVLENFPHDLGELQRSSYTTSALAVNNHCTEEGPDYML